MNFVSLTPDYWDGPRHNRHYFCEELAKQHKVLFVSPPIYIVRLLRALRRGTLPNSGVLRVGDNLHTYVPPIWLFTNHRFPWLNRLMRELRIWKLKRLMRRLGITEPILLVWHPAHLELVGRLNERLVIYYVYDHLSGYSGSTGARASSELELLRRADLVFVLSRKLYEENRPYASNLHVLPNAVDYDMFARSRDPALPIPDDIAAIPAPRIGYIGSINEKVDIELLDYIAAARPGWSLVLIGRDNFQTDSAKQKYSALVARANVHWLPYKQPETLPAYLKALDVCLMCYVVNGWTLYGDPSKMHEYLASGKPTIGAPLPAIQEFGDVIPVPDSQDGWIQAIEDGLQRDTEDKRRRRIEVAQENSYPQRIRVAVELIRQALQ